MMGTECGTQFKEKGKEIWTAVMKFIVKYKTELFIAVMSIVALFDSISDMATAATAYLTGNTKFFVAIILGDFVGGLVTGVHHLMNMSGSKPPSMQTLFFVLLLFMLNPVATPLLALVWHLCQEWRLSAGTQTSYYLYQLAGNIRGTLESPTQIIILLVMMSVGLLPLPWTQETVLVDTLGNTVHLGKVGLVSILLSSCSIFIASLRPIVSCRDIEMWTLVMCNILLKVFCFTIFFTYIREYTVIVLIYILLGNLVVAKFFLDTREISSLSTAFCSLFVLTIIFKKPDSSQHLPDSSQQCNELEKENHETNSDHKNNTKSSNAKDIEGENHNTLDPKKAVALMTIVTSPAIYITLLIVRYGIIDRLIDFTPDPNIIFGRDETVFFIDFFLHVIFWITVATAVINLIGKNDRWSEIRRFLAALILIGLLLTCLVHAGLAIASLANPAANHYYYRDAPLYRCIVSGGRLKVEKIRSNNFSHGRLEATSNLTQLNCFRTKGKTYNCSGKLAEFPTLTNPESSMLVVNSKGLEELIKRKEIVCGECTGLEQNLCNYIFRASADVYLCTSESDGIRWRTTDNRCGPQFPLDDGSPSECDPLGNSGCCSEYGYCDESVGHCDCPGCKDYRPKVRRDYFASLQQGKFRSDNRCGALFPLPDNNTAFTECHGLSQLPCCSEFGYCNLGIKSCDESRGAIDYRPVKAFDPTHWEGVYRPYDNRCGPEFPLPDGSGNVTECDPDSSRPCCNKDGWCSEIAAWSCECEECKDYRVVRESRNSSRSRGSGGSF